MMKTKTLNRNQRSDMADDADNKGDKRGAGATIVMIPATPRYWFGRWGNAARQIEDGSWVRYDDHVALMQRMQ